MIAELKSAPTVASLYRRAVINTALKGKPEPALPDLGVSLKGIKTSRRQIQKYARVCGFVNLDALPVTYPHILAFPLHMEILVDKRFPYPLLGLVHVSNQITQHRPIRTGETLDITCQLTGQREVDKGIEFDIATTVYSEQELVWESSSSMLHRTRSAQKKTSDKERKTPEVTTYDHSVRWSVPNNIGRSYGSVSGDVNPIHLFGLTAKLFGFPKHIAHGMWSKARCLAELEMELPKTAFTVNAKFKLPLFLPAVVQLMYSKVDGEIHFELRDELGEKPHLAASIVPAS